MADRNFLFEHEIASRLSVPPLIAARLHRYGYLDVARKMISACVAVYDTHAIDTLRQSLSEDGELADTLEYLNEIDREL